MGGGARYSLSALYRNSRSIVRHRLQMGAAGTSDAGEANRMQEVIGLDFQNCLQTGDKTMTLTGNRIDGHSVPCVLIQGGVLHIRREDGSDLCTQRMCKHSCPKRL